MKGKNFVFVMVLVCVALLLLFRRHLKFFSSPKPIFLSFSFSHSVPSQYDWDQWSFVFPRLCASCTFLSHFQDSHDATESWMLSYTWLDPLIQTCIISFITEDHGTFPFITILWIDRISVSDWAAAHLPLHKPNIDTNCCYQLTVVTLFYKGGEGLRCVVAQIDRWKERNRMWQMVNL